MNISIITILLLSMFFWGCSIPVKSLNEKGATIKQFSPLYPIFYSILTTNKLTPADGDAIEQLVILKNNEIIKGIFINKDNHASVNIGKKNDNLSGRSVEFEKKNGEWFVSGYGIWDS